MTIGSLPMNCTEIGTEFSTATPFQLGNATLLTAGGLSKPYDVSSWVGKSASTGVTPSGYYDAGSNVYSGYGPPISGSSVNPTTFRGYVINSLYGTADNELTPTELRFALTGNVAQNFFTSIVIGGNTYTTLSASYNQSGGVTTWWWSPTDWDLNGAVCTLS